MDDNRPWQAAYEHGFQSVMVWIWRGMAEWMEQVVSRVDSGGLSPDEAVDLLRDYAERLRDHISDTEAKRFANAVELDLAGMSPPPDPPTP
jgi:uncharacterized protein (DUF2267 family)